MSVKITVETLVKAKLDRVWDAWNNPEPEFQRQGWQAVLDNFGRHVEAQ